MRFLVIVYILVNSCLMLRAQSEVELFYYKIKEYYSRSIENEPDYYKDIPVVDSIDINERIINDSLFNLNRMRLVNIILEPIPKITISINDSIKGFEKDSLKEIIILLKKKNSDIISRMESAASNLVGNLDNIVFLENFSDQLSDSLYRRIYVDSILVNPEFITVLSFLRLNDEEKSFILDDKRSSIYCKAHLGDMESLREISIKFWKLIDEDYNLDISRIIQLASWIIIIDDKELNQEYLKALQSDKIIYNKPDDQGNVSAYSLSYLMITAYNMVYYRKLDYFMRYVNNNPNIVSAMEPYYYYKAISLYFQDIYKQKIDIKSRRFLYDTNIKYLK